MEQKTGYELYLELYEQSAELIEKAAALSRARLGIMKKYKGFKPNSIVTEGLTIPDELMLKGIDNLIAETNELLHRTTITTIELLETLTGLSIDEIIMLS